MMFTRDHELFFDCSNLDIRACEGIPEKTAIAHFFVSYEIVDRQQEPIKSENPPGLTAGTNFFSCKQTLINIMLLEKSRLC